MTSIQSTTPLETTSAVDAVLQRSPGDERVLASVTADSIDEAIDAVHRLDIDDWKLAIVFANSPDGLRQTGERLRADWPGIRAAGCTSSGIVDRKANVGAAVQITLFAGPGFSCELAMGPLDEGTSRMAGSTAAQAVTNLADRLDHTVLILLDDGLVGDTNHIVRGAYETVGATVPIVGGCAGDDLAMVATHQLVDASLVSENVVGIALSSTGTFGLGVNHGWVPTGQQMTVTAAQGTSVLSLDDRPALEVYLEVIGAQIEDVTPAGLAQLCQASPLGLPTRGGYSVRFIRGGDIDERSIEFLVAVPEGELVTVMRGGTESIIGAAGEATAQALAELDGSPLGMIAFDCVACRGVIGDPLLPEEVASLAEHLPAEATLSGLYTYGEIARRGGGLGFHNQTMVVLAIQ